MHNIFYMNYEERFFILHVAELKNVIYSWISIVEPEKKMEPKYQATITYYNKDSQVSSNPMNVVSLPN